MTIKRLFQHYEGIVKPLEGVVLNEIKYLYDNESEHEDIILVWLKTDSDTWIRIFIDGAYCGIDEYLYDESECDLDESVSIVDYSRWINGNSITNANVDSTELPEITLSINLSNKKRIVFACDQDENCSIQFLKKES